VTSKRSDLIKGFMIHLVFECSRQKDLIKYLLEFYLEKGAVILVNNLSLASLYRLENYQLDPNIDRVNWWKLDILLAMEAVTIASVTKNQIDILGFWWNQSQRGEKLVIWHEADLNYNWDVFTHARSIILSDRLEEKNSIKLPELFLSEANKNKVDCLPFVDILNKFDLKKFTTDISGYEIDRPTYHRVRKYVDRMKLFVID
jgi:hypothetical protein